MSGTTISADQLAELARTGRKIDLIDVRTPAEFRESHVEFARNFPLEHLEPLYLMAQRPESGEELLYVICRSGNRSQQACEKLAQAGFHNAVNVAGGTLACEQAGLAMVRGPKTMSLERQVRIAAGSLVLTGVLLAWLVHPYFIGIAAFVGAGLVFAGMTDTCGMAMILARLPWNQCGTGRAS